MGNWQYSVVLAGTNGGTSGLDTRWMKLKCLCEGDTIFQSGKDWAFSYGWRGEAPNENFHLDALESD